jgi:hypothetical protein
MVDADDADLDIEEFLNGFDYYDREVEGEGEVEVEVEDEKKFQSPFFLFQGSGGCLSAIENICIAELLDCLSSQCQGSPPTLLRSNSSINNDLNAWISHW